MTDELRDRIGVLAFSVCQTLCWGLDHNVGLDYWVIDWWSVSGLGIRVAGPIRVQAISLRHVGTDVFGL
jgi:hypothetical protein